MTATFRIKTVAMQHKDEVVLWAVKMALTGEMTRGQVAQELGIPVATIHRWVQDAIDQSPYRDTFQHLVGEVEALRRQNAELKKVVQGRKPRSPRVAAAGMTVARAWGTPV